MASTTTLATLRQMARRRSDQENSNFIPDAEFNDYINSAAQELYDILVSKTQDYYTISSNIVTDGTSNSFNLPSNFYKLVLLEYSLNGRMTPMKRFNFQEKNRYENNAQILRYRIIKDQIQFNPVPAAQTVVLWYVPAFTRLSSDSDTLDGVNGWEEYVVVEAAIKAAIKDEADVSALMAQKQALMKRIEDMSDNRDQGLPDRVIDVSNLNVPREYFYGDY